MNFYVRLITEMDRHIAKQFYYSQSPWLNKLRMMHLAYGAKQLEKISGSCI